VFHDHSVADAATVRRTWTFDGGTPATSTAEHPRVTYSAPGTYRVRLVVQDIGGVSEHVVDSMVTIVSTCNPDDLAVSALDCNGVDGLAVMKPLRTELTSATFTAWIRTSGTQNDFAGIVFSRGGGTVAGLSIMADNTLRYHWADRGWANVVTQKVPLSTWTHVALVVTPASTTIYVNGIGETFAGSNAPQSFAGDLYIGRDPTSVLRHFKGLIDEVRVYERALTQRELREMMHRTNASVTGLLAYYQFNEQGRAVIDRHGDHPGTVSASVGRAASTAPGGRGTAMTQAVPAGGVYTWNDVGMALRWPMQTSVPNGDVVVTRLREFDASALGTVGRVVANSMFVIHSFGERSFTRPLAIDIEDVLIQEQEAARPADLVVFGRPWHGDAPWDTPVGMAASAVAGPKGRVSFQGGTFFTSSTQIVLASRQTVGVSVGHRPTGYRIAPLPASEILTISLDAEGDVEVFDLTGRLCGRWQQTERAVVDVRRYPVGAYVVRVTCGDQTHAEMIVVQR
jgi:PKD repeat protein